MQAAIFNEYGGPGVVHTAEVPTPEPGPGEVRVAVRATALNHLDLFVRRGLPIDIAMPHIGGSDIAGTVDLAGAGVTDIRRGDRVVVNPSLSCGTCEWCEAGEDPLCPDYRIIGEHVPGGLAEFVVVPGKNLLGVPDEYDLETAAAAPLTFLTAWRALTTRGRLREGEKVLVTGASGGVSTAAIQIARYLGAEVHAITTAENLHRVRELGAHHVWDRGQPDHRKNMWRATDRRGFALILDSVGEATWEDNIRALARAGRLVVYGRTTGSQAVTDLRHVFWRQLEILGTTMSNREEFEAVMALVFDRLMTPVIDTVFPLGQASAAHERLESGGQFGKILVTP